MATSAIIGIIGIAFVDIWRKNIIDIRSNKNINIFVVKILLNGMLVVQNQNLDMGRRSLFLI